MSQAKSSGAAGRPTKDIITKKDAEKTLKRLDELRGLKAKLEAELPEFAWLRANNATASTPSSQSASTSSPALPVSGNTPSTAAAGSGEHRIDDADDDDDGDDEVDEDDENGNAAFERAYAVAELGHTGVQKLVQKNLYAFFGLALRKSMSFLTRGLLISSSCC